ncbi:MAG: hypothetical protein K0R15_1398 [Clostridiales bacterium]|nr:hypothetical protein [Clostridiales bacterium]
MAKETVQAIREAELKASQIEKDAAGKRDEIILKAEEDAKVKISSVIKEALAKAEQDLEQAQFQGTERMKNAVIKAEQEILELKEMVKSKEQVAIDLVLAQVI